MLTNQKRPLEDDDIGENGPDPLLSLLHISPSDSTSTPTFYQTHFQRIADSLLNDFVLSIKTPTENIYYRLVEIEFYLRDNIHNHDDPFAHGQPMQSTCGQWYFHRRGNSYVGGSFKGFDLTFGRTYPPNVPSPYYNNISPPATALFRGGILIRSISRVQSFSTAHTLSTSSASLVEGPCKCVETIMKHLDCKTMSVKDLVDTHLNSNISAIPTDNGLLTLVKIPPISPETKKPRLTTNPTTSSPPRSPIYSTPRIGLYLRPSHENLSHRITYVTKPYRFLSLPSKILKTRGVLIAGLYQMLLSTSLPRKSDSESDESVLVRLTGMQKALVGKCLVAYKEGKEDGDPVKFVGDKLGSAEVVCKFVGAVDGWIEKRKEEEGIGEEVE
ncbi:hypothetical protein HK097_010798 [Rhizophlyctis rosea]|uniref:Uncharacterized protein n=1 Tax=Rhizophlyctis rosea TaxID=64517 RepID=A0AAD5X2B2_9FUNG|nr:hypothetical protein HK097_010798 [Rhizophlyctis rosea]